MSDSEINTTDIIDLSTDWDFDIDFYIPGDIGDTIGIKISDKAEDIYYLSYNGTDGNVTSIDISNNSFGTKTISSVDNSTFGNLSVTMIGGSGISANEEVACLTNTCKILTPTGYMNIYKLRKDDLVLNSKYEEIKIKKVYRKIFKVNDKNRPFLIKKNQLAYNIPSKDTYLSPNHFLLYKNKWIKAKDISLINNWEHDKICYYNLELTDYLEDNLIVNNMIVESWDGKLTYENRNYTWKKQGKFCLRIK